MRTIRANRAAPVPPDLGGTVDWRGCKPSETGSLVPVDLSQNVWADVGRGLCRIDSSSRWWFADWWIGGSVANGARRALVDSDDWQGPAFQTCMNGGLVARAFPTSRRREVLTFGHHAELLHLPANEADALLDWAEETVAATDRPRSVRALRAERQRRDREKQAKEENPRSRTISANIKPDPSRPRHLSLVVSPYSAGAPGEQGSKGETIGRPVGPRHADSEAARLVVAATQRALTLSVSDLMRARLKRVVADLLEAPGSSSFH
jgi:hypothetical protein